MEARTRAGASVDLRGMRRSARMIVNVPGRGIEADIAMRAFRNDSGDLAPERMLDASERSPAMSPGRLVGMLSEERDQVIGLARSAFTFNMPSFQKGEHHWESRQRVRIADLSERTLAGRGTRLKGVVAQI